MKRIALIALIIIGFIVDGTWAFERHFFSGFRTKGLGGSKITFFNDEYTVISNPANLVYNEKSRITVSLLDVYYNTVVSDAVNLYKAIKDGSQNYSEAITTLKSAVIDLGMENIPLIPVSYYSKNLALAVNSGFDIKLTARKMFDVFNAYLDGEFQFNSQIAVGYAKSIRLPVSMIKKLNLGISGGVYNRVSIVADKVDMNGVQIADQFYLYSNSDYPESKTIDYIKDNILDFIENRFSPFFNIGSSVDILSFLRTAVTIQDIANSINPMTINCGVLFKPLYLIPPALLKPINKSQTIIKQDDALVILEMYDIFGPGFFEKMHIGMELKGLYIFDEPMIYLDFGLNYGYPTFGLGIRARFVELSYANITYEEGSYLGAKPNIVNNFSLKLRF